MGPLLTWQPIHCLQKEWAGGFSVCWASPGSPEKGALVWLPVWAQTGAADTEEVGTRQGKGRGGCLPQDLLWPSRLLFCGHLHDLGVTLGLRREVWGFQQDLRFLWLPKDTKLERPTLHGAPGREGQCLDYTQLLATM